MNRKLSFRERDALAVKARKEHWERKANNKTYEQWQAEQINNVHKMMDIIERILGL